MWPWQTVRQLFGALGPPNGIDRHAVHGQARSYNHHTPSILDLPSKTVTAGTHGPGGGSNCVTLDDGTIRYFTLRELAGLQGFPAGYQFDPVWSRAVREIGNACPPPLAHSWAVAMRRCILGPPTALTRAAGQDDDDHYSASRSRCEDPNPAIKPYNVYSAQLQRRRHAATWRHLYRGLTRPALIHAAHRASQRERFRRLCDALRRHRRDAELVGDQQSTSANTTLFAAPAHAGTRTCYDILPLCNSDSLAPLPDAQSWAVDTLATDLLALQALRAEHSLSPTRPRAILTDLNPNVLTAEDCDVGRKTQSSRGYPEEGGVQVQPVQVGASEPGRLIEHQLRPGRQMADPSIEAVSTERAMALDAARDPAPAGGIAVETTPRASLRAEGAAQVADTSLGKMGRMPAHHHASEHAPPLRGRGSSLGATGEDVIGSAAQPEAEAEVPRRPGAYGGGWDESGITPTSPPACKDLARTGKAEKTAVGAIRLKGGAGQADSTADAHDDEMVDGADAAAAAAAGRANRPGRLRGVMKAIGRTLALYRRVARPDPEALKLVDLDRSAEGLNGHLRAAFRYVLIRVYLTSWQRGGTQEPPNLTKHRSGGSTRYRHRFYAAYEYGAELPSRQRCKIAKTALYLRRYVLGTGQFLFDRTVAHPPAANCDVARFHAWCFFCSIPVKSHTVPLDS